MDRPNLRHLRVLLAVARLSSVTRAAEYCNLSQPAVTQAISGFERKLAIRLFVHTKHGLYTTDAGERLATRVERVLCRLDEVLTPLSPRLPNLVTIAQLKAFITVVEVENFSLAARQMGLSQPTVHRAVSHIESTANQPLFRRRASGVTATRAAVKLADGARLALSELHQAFMELGELAGREVGHITVGAMPFSRSCLLPEAIIAFRAEGFRQQLNIEGGNYQSLLTALLRGELDLLICAMRAPLAGQDIKQIPLLEDDMVIVCRHGHPLQNGEEISLDTLRNWPWVVSRRDTPSNTRFYQMFESAGLEPPEPRTETASMSLLRQLVLQSDHLACISREQVSMELRAGWLCTLPYQIADSVRIIGLTMRRDWMPTHSQARLVELIQQSARNQQPATL